jgi:hypothetical protein
MPEPTTVMTTVLALTKEAARAAVPPLKPGWKRIYQDEEEFSPQLCHQIRIQILDKEEPK